MKKIEVKAGTNSYPVTIGTDLISGIGESLKRLPGFSPNKLVLFSNQKVFGLYGGELSAALYSAGFDYDSWIVPDGEEYKNLEYLEKSLDFFADARLSRDDAVISFGGGVIGDLAGFAASVYMRGIRFVQIPTTLLSMVDSSVGGKTAVNTVHGKNLAGTFHNPSAVYADVALLKSLEIRELCAGYYEIVKHGAIAGPDLLDSSAMFIERYPLNRFPEFFGDNTFLDELSNLVRAQILQKAAVVEADRFEDPSRLDSESRKILNFGHTVAHALEKVTGYSYFRHGEAVGYGMLAANEIAKKLEFCDNSSINLLNDVVLRVGSLPDASTIDINAVCEALLLDKKSSGKSLQWVLLERIGSPRIVSGIDVPDDVVRESLSSVLLAHKLRK